MLSVRRRGSAVRLHARLRRKHARCPLCLDELDPRGSWWKISRCPACGTARHRACARELAPCGILGCPATPSLHTQDVDPGEAETDPFATWPVGMGAALGFSLGAWTCLRVFSAVSLLNLGNAEIVAFCALLPLGTFLGGFFAYAGAAAGGALLAWWTRPTPAPRRPAERPPPEPPPRDLSAWLDPRPRGAAFRGRPELRA